MSGTERPVMFQKVVKNKRQGNQNHVSTFLPSNPWQVMFLKLVKVKTQGNQNHVSTFLASNPCNYSSERKKLWLVISWNLSTFPVVWEGGPPTTDTSGSMAALFRCLDGCQWLVRRTSYPKTLGSIPWWGRVRGRFSIPPSQLLCRLVCAWPPFMCTARTRNVYAR